MASTDHVPRLCPRCGNPLTAQRYCSKCRITPAADPFWGFLEGKAVQFAQQVFGKAPWEIPEEDNVRMQDPS